MKAIRWTAYGNPAVLQCDDVPVPELGDNEILLRIHYSTVTAGDCEMRRAKLPLMLSLPVRLYNGWKRPKRIQILGQEFAGTVEKTGTAVRIWKTGDTIFGTTGFSFSANGEYICLKEVPGDMSGIQAVIPEGVTFAQAAASPTAGMEAIHYLNTCGIGSGSKLLIIGAGGSIGTMALQIARYRGAEVTAVDSGEKLTKLKELGADQTLDYRRAPLSHALDVSGGRFDGVIDVVSKSPLAEVLTLIRPGGAYIPAFATARHLLAAPWVRLLMRRKISISSSSQSSDELAALSSMLKAGTVQTVIDREFPLELASDAHRYAESGQKFGNIVLVHPSS